MKKIIALLLTGMMAISILSACAGGSGKKIWEIKQSVDEFGDVTDSSESWLFASVNGDFSNTATESSELSCGFGFILNPNNNQYVAQIVLKEHGDMPVSYSSNDIITLKTKIDETVDEYYLSGEVPTGNLYLSPDDYEFEASKLFYELYSGNDIKCLISIGNSQYNFTLESGNFKKTADELGFAPQDTELTVRRAIMILLEDKVDYFDLASETFNNHLYDYPIATSDELLDILNGQFLELSASVGDYAADIGSRWSICNYTQEGFIKQGEIRYFPFDGTHYFSTESVKDGSELTKLTFKDDTYSYELKRVIGFVFVHKIAKLTDDIYIELLYNKPQPDAVLDPDTFIFGKVFIKCPEEFAEGTDGEQAVEVYLNHIKQDLIPQIP